MGFLNYFKHKGDEAKSRTSARQNKSVAQNSQVSPGVRARAAGNYIDDKLQTRKHKNKAELEEHKRKA